LFIKKYFLYELFISIVTYAEIKSLARQLHWGQSKIKQLEHVLSSFAILYINNKRLWFIIPFIFVSLQKKCHGYNFNQIIL